jgi:chromosome segregation ATPase
MYKKLAFIFLLIASLQAMPPKIAQKVEEMHGESDNESGGSSIKSKESPATSYEPHPLYVLPNIELMEEEISNNTKKFEEAIKASNKEKEELLQKYEKAGDALNKATKLLAEKQKELEELEGEADQLADKVERVAAQRDEYKSRVDDLERELDQKNKLFLLFMSVFSKSNEERDALLEYSKKTLKVEEKE